MKAGAGVRYFLKSLMVAIIVSSAWIDGAVAVAVEAFALPDALSANDDGSSAAVPIGFPINFFGVTHTALFVNNNGNVTFGAPLSTFTPFGLVGTRQPIIAPFFADVDTRAPASGVVRFGTPAGRPDLFVVDWVQVGYFREHDDKLNSFQLILQDLSAVPDFVPGDFRVIFNYDAIRWETGDASGGTNGLGGSSARVGFSNGSGQPGTFFELTGSGQNGALLDGGSRSLVGNKVPSADPSLPVGRYQFVVQNGAVAQADLAIAAEIIEDDDDTGFDLVVRNFGPSDAIPVLATFDLVGGGGRARIKSIRPRSFCEVDAPSGLRPPRGITCNFPSITNGASRRIRVIASEAVRGDAAVLSNVFDSDLSNNKVRASSSCKGEILSRSAPESVLYEPTATDPARQTLRLAIINTADDQSVEIRRIRLENIYTDPIFGTPLQIRRITPRLPETIGPGKGKVFRVETFVAAGMPARTAFRPYFQVRVRCQS
jgi:Nidogen-like